MNDILEAVNAHWPEIVNTVKMELGITEISCKTWLMPLRVSSIQGNTFIITSKSEQYDYGYIKSKYGIHLKDAISNFFDHEYEIEFRDTNEIVAEKANRGMGNQSYASELNPLYTFDNFIDSSSSNLAYSASLAVAESPGEYYNPLFIYGDAGLGKTHLMQAIAHFIIQRFPNKKVLYVTSEAFTNELVRSIKEGKSSPEEMRNKYRNLDVLLIDDIQFVIGKESTQEEFFNTFNVLREAKKQIVISSDKPPKEFLTLEDRLRSRFEWGLIVDIQPPTYEIRMAILRKKLESLNVNLNEEVLSYIAENVTSNIREMEGSLNKIIAIYKLQRLKKEEITLDLAKDALKSIISTNNKKKVDVNYIAEIVAEHYSITLNELYSNNRSKNIAYPRQIVMYLSRRLTSQSLTEIGEKLGNRDHTTILHGIQKIEKDIKENSTISDTIDILIKKINPQ